MDENKESQTILQKLKEEDGTVIILGTFFILTLLVGVLIGSMIVSVQDTGENGEITNDIEELNFDYPEWATEFGIEGEEQLRAAQENHSQYLLDTNYTVNVNIFEEESGQTSEFEYKYDSEQELANVLQSTGEQQTRIFENHSGEQPEQFVRNSDEGNITYDRAPILQPPFTGELEILEFINVVGVEAVEVIENEAEGNIVVYELGNVTEQELQGQINLDGEIHLHEDGYFPYMDIELEQQTQQGTMQSEQEFEIIDIGETTVQEPQWLSIALDETDELEEEDFELPEQPPEQEPPQQPPEQEPPEDLDEEDLDELQEQLDEQADELPPEEVEIIQEQIDALREQLEEEEEE